MVFTLRGRHDHAFRRVHALIAGERIDPIVGLRDDVFLVGETGQFRRIGLVDGSHVDRLFGGRHQSFLRGRSAGAARTLHRVIDLVVLVRDGGAAGVLRLDLDRAVICLDEDRHVRAFALAERQRQCSNTAEQRDNADDRSDHHATALPRRARVPAARRQEPSSPRRRRCRSRDRRNDRGRLRAGSWPPRFRNCRMARRRRTRQRLSQRRRCRRRQPPIRHSARDTRRWADRGTRSPQPCAPPPLTGWLTSSVGRAGLAVRRCKVGIDVVECLPRRLVLFIGKLGNVEIVRHGDRSLGDIDGLDVRSGIVGGSGRCLVVMAGIGGHRIGPLGNRRFGIGMVMAGPCRFGGQQIICGRRLGRCRRVVARMDFAFHGGQQIVQVVLRFLDDVGGCGDRRCGDLEVGVAADQCRIDEGPARLRGSNGRCGRRGRPPAQPLPARPPGQPSGHRRDRHFARPAQERLPSPAPGAPAPDAH